MPDSKKARVTFFHRKSLPVGHYSLEFIFADVRERLKDRIEARVVTSKYTSSGLCKRLYNVIEAACRQSAVNHVTGDVNYLGLLLGRRNTVQTILDCVHLQTTTGLKHKIIKLFWVTIPVRRARWVTAISTSTKQEILKYIDCDPAKIVVIPVAISGRFRRRDKPFNKANPRILQLGAAPNKNIPRLIEALQGIPCTLEIIGHHNPEYEALLRQSGIAYSYHSGLSDAEVLEKYFEADIVTLVSTYEGFGMPILEGQATGRPVITSNLYSMPEVAGDAACIVDPFDARAMRAGFRRLIEDDEYRQALVAKGFDNVKRFDPDRIAEQYLALYQDIAANH
jgi:glycosyltransferase involved in cell wall biosynthesis